MRHPGFGRGTFGTGRIRIVDIDFVKTGCRIDCFGINR